MKSEREREREREKNSFFCIYYSSNENNNQDFFVQYSSSLEMHFQFKQMKKRASPVFRLNLKIDERIYSRSLFVLLFFTCSFVCLHNHSNNKHVFVKKRFSRRFIIISNT